MLLSLSYYFTCLSHLIARPATQPLNFEDIQARSVDNKPFVFQIMMISTYVLVYSSRKSGMRRGMLMTVLQQYAQEQDVWRGKPGETYVYY